MGFPVSTWADGGSTVNPPLVDDPNNPVTSLKCDSQDYSKLTGTLEPNGAAAHTYHYNYDTCLWENDYYTWSPVTKDYTAKYNTDYTWNPITQTWDTMRWVFNTAKDQYDQVTVSVAPSYLMPAPGSSTGQNSNSSSTDPSANASTNNASGPDSSSTSNSNANNNITLNSGLFASVTNNLTQLAISGDVNALQNTYVGDAQSGNSSDII